MWRLDISTGEWECLRYSGDCIGTLQEHTMVAYLNNLYIFGGGFVFGGDADVPLWIFNAETLHSHKYRSEVISHNPTGRRGHTAVVHGNGMYLFGGYIDLKGSNSELWRFDFLAQVWTLLSSTETYSGECPSGRHNHSAVTDLLNTMWIYGGVSDLNVKDDLWCWQLDKGLWIKPRVRYGPPELEGHSACTLRDSMLIFGGQSHGVLQNDLWMLQFNTLTWSKVTQQALVCAPCVRHCSVLISGNSPQCGATTSRRSRSTPHVRGSALLPATNSNFTLRPHTSPSVHSYQNKVSPCVKHENSAFENSLYSIAMAQGDHAPRQPSHIDNFITDRQSEIASNELRRFDLDAKSTNQISVQAFSNPVFMMQLSDSGSTNDRSGMTNDSPGVREYFVGGFDDKTHLLSSRSQHCASNSAEVGCDISTLVSTGKNILDIAGAKDLLTGQSHDETFASHCIEAAAKLGLSDADVDSKPYMSVPLEAIPSSVITTSQHDDFVESAYYHDNVSSQTCLVSVNDDSSHVNNKHISNCDRLVINGESSSCDSSLSLPSVREAWTDRTVDLQVTVTSTATANDTNGNSSGELEGSWPQNDSSTQQSSTEENNTRLNCLKWHQSLLERSPYCMMLVVGGRFTDTTPLQSQPISIWKLDMSLGETRR